MDLRYASVGPRNPAPSPPVKNAHIVEVTLAGHYLPADLLRAFGSAYWYSATMDQPGARGLRITQLGKRLQLTRPGAAGRFRAPVVDHLRFLDGTRSWVQLTTLDTRLAFGTGTLDALARAFAGVGKPTAIPEEAKARMSGVFRDRPRDAYAYAATDAILTLLTAEGMVAEDRRLFDSFGLSKYAPKRMKPTMGARAAATLEADARRAAEGSTALSGKGGPSRTKIAALFRAGGGPAVAARSRFGQQTGDVHGGLTLSRTPDRPFDAAPGQFRDVDLCGCYPSIVKRMHLYLVQFQADSCVSGSRYSQP